MTHTAIPAGEPKKTKKSGLPLFGKIGIVGILGGFASIVGFSVDFTPSLGQMMVQGMGPSGRHEGQAAYTLHLVNAGEGPVQNVHYRIKANGQAAASGSVSFLDAGRHSGEQLPAFRQSGPTELCVLYTASLEFPVLSLFGISFPVTRKLTTPLDAEARSYSDYPGYQVRREETTSVLAGLFGKLSCD